mgnify:CR=1 FL=1
MDNLPEPTQSQGELWDRYCIYVACVQGIYTDEHVKSFDEWLQS